MSEWRTVWSGFVYGIGTGTIFLSALFLTYYGVISAFYDPAFNDGFEAGRRSMYQDCYVNGKTYKCYPPAARGEAQ